MSTPPTAPTRSQEQSAASLFTDVKSTADAIERGDWLQAGLGMGNVAMDIIGLGGDPLGAVTSAGFGWLIQNISFLREPFDVLLGDPGAITGSAQGWTGASESLTQTAAQYRSASRQETSNWTGAAGDAYRSASATQARGLDSLAQVSKAVSEALRGAGQALADARKAVLDVINKACEKIIQIIIEALAASWGTFGASIAKGIVQSVQTAIQAAQKALSRIQKLVSTLQKIMQLIQKVMQLAQAVKQLLELIGGKASGGENQPAPQPFRPSLNYSGNLADGTSPSGAAGTPGRRPADPVGPRVQPPPLPSGVPSWGPSGPPPNPGRPASRVDQARWIGDTVRILIEHGVDPSKIDAARIAQIVNQTSGGNPHAVNLQDPSAQHGYPPKGLMQITDPTFQQHRIPGYNDIYQPVDNLIAGIRHLLIQFDSLTHTLGSTPTSSR